MSYPGPKGFRALVQAATDVRESFVRFPISILSALLGTAIFIHELHSRTPSGSFFDNRNGITAIVGISVAALATLWGESRRLAREVVLLISAGLTLCLWLVSWRWKQLGLNDQEFISRSFQLALVTHLAIGYLPAARLTSNGFWQYNRFLFRRMVLVGVYAAIIALGLIAAVLAAKYLLDIPFKDSLLLDILFVGVFAYHPCVALAAMPKNIETFETHHEYAPEIAVVAKFILLPLVALYGAILYLYLGKILLSWELPRGGVGYLVSSASLLGVFCFLLLEPVIVANIRWQQARSIYFFLLFPLIFLLFLGLKVRVGHYGLTSHRYLLIIYGAWITGTAVYFLASKVRNIKVVPASLGLLTFFTLVGPWSAYELPAYYQFRSLKAIMHREGLFMGSMATKGDKVQSLEVQEEILSKIKYLLASSQRENLLKLFLSEKEIEVEMGDKARSGHWDNSLQDRLAKHLGFRGGNPRIRLYFSEQYREQFKPVSLKGFSQFIPTVESSGDPFRLRPEGTKLRLVKGDTIIATFELRRYLENIESLRVEGKRIEITCEGAPVARLLLRNLSGYKSDDKLEIDGATAGVLLR